MNREKIERFPDGFLLFLLKEGYPVVCPVCNEELIVVPSMAMQGGINSGHITCPNCGTSLHVQIDKENEKMIAQEMLEWTSQGGLT